MPQQAAVNALFTALSADRRAYDGEIGDIVAIVGEDAVRPRLGATASIASGSVCCAPLRCQLCPTLRVSACFLHQTLAQTAMVLCGLHGHVDAMDVVSRRWGISVWECKPCGVCLFCTPPCPVHRCKPPFSSHRVDEAQFVASFSGLLGACASGSVEVVERVVTRFVGSAVWLSSRTQPSTAEVCTRCGCSWCFAIACTCLATRWRRVARFSASFLFSSTDTHHCCLRVGTVTWGWHGG